MLRLRLVCAAALSALASLPAAAADYPGRYLDRGYAWSGPYYVVNQGPEMSGPGITITDIPLTRTGVRRVYPYIRSFGERPYIVTSTDYYGVVPAMLDPSARTQPVSRAPWRRPTKTRGPR